MALTVTAPLRRQHLVVFAAEQIGAVVGRFRIDLTQQRMGKASRWLQALRTVTRV
jgi:hypothetical protein